MDVYDVTPAINESLKVWPGDTPPSRQVLCDLEDGANITLSSLHTTVHIGAHADAPSHYGPGAPSIEKRPLEDYIGSCQVIAVDVARGCRVEPEMLDVSISAERILIATGSFPDPRAFNEDFAALSVELVDFAAARGVRLIGIDTPSVDLFDSKDLPAHRAFLRNDMSILEGLVLNGVPAGVYELIALPLKLVGFDASPVRAILRPLRH